MEQITNDDLLALLSDWTNQFVADQQPMDDELSKVFMNVFMMEGNGADIPDAIKNTFMYQVLERRFKFLEVEASPYVLAFLAFLVKSPGEAVMFMYALRVRNGKGSLTMSHIANVFMMGFPSDAYRSKMWDKQKIGGANMLDMVDVRSL